MVFVWLFLCVLSETFQQVCFSISGQRQNNVKMRWLGLGILLYLVQLAMWLWVLTLLPLGVAAPLMAATYITVPFAGKFLLKETLDTRRLVGMGVIFLGLVLIASVER